MEGSIGFFSKGKEFLTINVIQKELRVYILTPAGALLTVKIGLKSKRSVCGRVLMTRLWQLSGDYGLDLEGVTSRWIKELINRTLIA